jgi:hypothetical protein
MRILLYLLLFQHYCYSQDNDVYAIKVVDGTDQTTIPFVTARSLKFNIGTNSTIDGVLRIDKRQYGDSIIITSIGFNDTLIVLAKNEFTLPLSRQYQNLPAIIVKNHRKIGSVQFGETTKKGKFIWTSSGKGDFFVKAFKLDNANKSYKLKKVSIHVDRYFDEIPIVLHVMDSKNGKPNADLLQSASITSSMKYHSKKNLLEFDIESQNLIINDSIVFIGIEILPYRSDVNSPKSIGITMTDNSPDEATWAKSYTHLNYSWSTAPRRPHQTNPSNIVLKISGDLYGE